MPDCAALLPENNRNRVFQKRIVSKLLPPPWCKNLQGLTDSLVDVQLWIVLLDSSAYNARNMQSSQFYSRWLEGRSR